MVQQMWSGCCVSNLSRSQQEIWMEPLAWNLLHIVFLGLQWFQCQRKGQNPVLTESVVQAVKDTVDVPVLAKLTPNVTDIKEIAIAAANGGADGITLINSLGPGMRIDITTGHPILANKFGGMSGPAIKPIAIRCVYDVYDVVDIPIVGVGGIRNYEDVVEFLYAGANAVQIGTSILYDGPEIFSDIAIKLSQFIESSSFNSIEDMIGFAHKDGDL